MSFAKPVSSPLAMWQMLQNYPLISSTLAAYTGGWDYPHQGHGGDTTVTMTPASLAMLHFSQGSANRNNSPMKLVVCTHLLFVKQGVPTSTSTMHKQPGRIITPLRDYCCKRAGLLHSIPATLGEGTQESLRLPR